MELSCCDVHKLHSSSSACEVNSSNGWMSLSDIISLIGIILTENLSKLILWHTWCRGAFLLKEIFTIRPWSLNTRFLNTQVVILVSQYFVLWSYQTCVNASIMATDQTCPTAALAILSLLFETCYNQIMTCSIILSWLLASHITTYHLRPTNICIHLPPPISTCHYLPPHETACTRLLPLAPTFTNLHRHAPKCHHLHQIAQTCTHRPLSEPTCAKLHQLASTCYHLYSPTITCHQMNQLAPACTRMHPLAPTSIHLWPLAAIHHLHLLATTCTH